MIMSEHGTSLIYYPSKNEITIVLPQTAGTATNTISPVVNRIVDVPDKSLSVLVWITEQLFGIRREA